MILHFFLRASGTWIAWFSLLDAAVGGDWRKPGVLPIGPEDCTILTICDSEHTKGSPYNRKLLWLGWKPWRRKGSSQLGDIWVPETQLSLSHFLCPKHSANHPFPDSVLWWDKVQWLRFLLWSQTTEGKMGCTHKHGFMDSPPVLQGMLHLANLGRISK